MKELIPHKEFVNGIDVAVISTEANQSTQLFMDMVDFIHQFYVGIPIMGEDGRIRKSDIDGRQMIMHNGKWIEEPILNQGG